MMSVYFPRLIYSLDYVTFKRGHALCVEMPLGEEGGGEGDGLPVCGSLVLC